MSKRCERGLVDRCRDDDGGIRRKNGNTLVGTLRQLYGDDFAGDVRSDMKLRTLLELTDADSLSELVRRHRR
jgi:hypothetical protein